MNNIKHNRIEEAIREAAGLYVAREGGTTSIITITRVSLDEKGRKAIIFYTCIPEDKENAAFGFLKRSLTGIREFCQSRIKTHTIPYLDVMIDDGEKNFRHINSLLREDEKGK